MKRTALTTREGDRLEQLEARIDAGKKTFIEVGSALAEIRDGKLYRASFKTFDDYCREKWGWDRTYCHRIIAAAAAVKMLPIGNEISSESQARELAKADPEARAAIVETANAAAKAEGRTMTARDIRETIDAEVIADPEPDRPRVRSAEDAALEWIRTEVEATIQNIPN
jgi:hypothetical protein